MAARCHCCLADHGSETRVSAVTNDLWSVQSWKSRRSRMCLQVDGESFGCHHGEELVKVVQVFRCRLAADPAVI
jgi:hypothetical protein